MTQRQLADLVASENRGLRVDQAKISLWETGRRKPTDDQRIALAAALAVRPQTLFPYPAGAR